MQRQRVLVALAALVVIGLVTLVMRRDRSTSGRGVATTEERTRGAAGAPAPSGPHASDAAETASEPPAPASHVAPEAAVAQLRQGLASDDEAVRIAAVEAAVSSTSTSTLADLERFDLVRDPETAPTVIHAVALLGASAEGKERETAASTLESWLTSELRRDAPDARGNVSNIVEALGELGGKNAVTALDSMLDRGDTALHLQTLAVQKLGELADASARPSVERFAQRTGALPPGEGLDEELRVEAIEAAKDTLAKL